MIRKGLLAPCTNPPHTGATALAGTSLLTVAAFKAPPLQSSHTGIRKGRKATLGFFPELQIVPLSQLINLKTASFVSSQPPCLPDRGDLKPLSPGCGRYKGRFSSPCFPERKSLSHKSTQKWGRRWGGENPGPTLHSNSLVHSGDLPGAPQKGRASGDAHCQTICTIIGLILIRTFLAMHLLS